MKQSAVKLENGSETRGIAPPAGAIAPFVNAGSTRSSAVAGAENDITHLPGCPDLGPAYSDIRATASNTLRARSHHRRSKGADARFIEEKRAAEGALCASVADAYPRLDRTMPNDPGTANLGHDLWPNHTSSHEKTDTRSPSGAVDTCGPKQCLVPWFRRSIYRCLVTNEDGTISETVSINRLRAPQWRDLCDEARLDWYQDAGIAIAATLKNHKLWFVTINLERSVERKAVAKPHALEWCKYRIVEALRNSGVGATFVMVSEEALVRDRAEQERREELGLHRTRRFHTHSLFVLRDTKRSRQRFRDLLRQDTVVGRWTGGSQRYQISIEPGEARELVDYMAKDLYLAGDLMRLHDRHTSSWRFKNYQGASLSVSNDIRLKAIELYDIWRMKNTK